MTRTAKLLSSAALCISPILAEGNTRILERQCSAVWPAAIRTMIANDFRPTVMDRDSGIATFSFEKALNGADADNYVLTPKFMKGLESQLMHGHPMRLVSASLVLVEQSGKCSLTIKTMGYAIFISRSAGWEPLETNFAFEARLLDATASESKSSQ